eukprot:scaffold2946_cov294-Pinguiococcus_pyrenoidosus.AAC.4
MQRARTKNSVLRSSTNEQGESSQRVGALDTSTTPSRWSTIAIVVAYHPGQVLRVVGERGAHEAKVHDGGSGQEARSHHAEVRHCGLEELSETRLGRVEHASVRRRRLCFCGCSRQNARTSEALERATGSVSTSIGSRTRSSSCIRC